MLLLAGLLLVFLTVRSWQLWHYAALFENIEDYRLAASAKAVSEALRVYPQPADWPRLFSLYPPDHFALGGWGAVLRFAVLRTATGPFTPFTFRWESLLLQMVALACWLLLLVRWHPPAAYCLALLYILLPPSLAALVTQYPDSHGGAALFVALYVLALAAWQQRSPSTGRPAALLGMLGSVAALQLPSLACLIPFGMFFALQRRSWRDVLAMAVGALPGCALIILIHDRYAGFCWQDVAALGVPSLPPGSKLTLLFTTYLPQLFGDSRLVWPAAIVAAAAAVLLSLRHRRHRVRLAILLGFPLLYLAGYLFTSFTIYPGLWPPHTCKYLAPLLLPCLAWFSFIIAHYRRLLPLLLILIAGLSLHAWTLQPPTPPAVRDNAQRVALLGATQYGETMVQVLDLPFAMAAAPRVTPADCRHAYLRGVGTYLRQRMVLDTSSYAVAAPAADLAAFRAGFADGIAPDAAVSLRTRLYLAPATTAVAVRLP